MSTAAPGLRSPMLAPFRGPLAGRLALCVAALSLASCGREKPTSDLTFENLPDTTRLTQGAPVLEEFEPYRMANGAMRVKGRARLPDGTRIQIAIKAPDGRVSLTMAHVYVQQGQFDSPPLIGATGPLPKARYRFEVLAHFRDDWQEPDVMRALHGGDALRGPGITRATDGRAALFLVREATL